MDRALGDTFASLHAGQVVDRELADEARRTLEVVVAVITGPDARAALDAEERARLLDRCAGIGTLIRGRGRDTGADARSWRPAAIEASLAELEGHRAGGGFDDWRASGRLVLPGLERALRLASAEPEAAGALVLRARAFALLIAELEHLFARVVEIDPHTEPLIDMALAQLPDELRRFTGVDDALAPARRRAEELRAWRAAEQWDDGAEVTRRIARMRDRGHDLWPRMVASYPGCLDVANASPDRKTLLEPGTVLRLRHASDRLRWEYDGEHCDYVPRVAGVPIACSYAPELAEVLAALAVRLGSKLSDHRIDEAIVEVSGVRPLSEIRYDVVLERFLVVRVHIAPSARILAVRCGPLVASSRAPHGLSRE